MSPGRCILQSGGSVIAECMNTDAVGCVAILSPGDKRDALPHGAVFEGGQGVSRPAENARRAHQKAPARPLRPANGSSCATRHALRVAPTLGAWSRRPRRQAPAGDCPVSRIRAVRMRADSRRPNFVSAALMRKDPGRIGRDDFLQPGHNWAVGKQSVQVFPETQTHHGCSAAGIGKARYPRLRVVGCSIADFFCQLVTSLLKKHRKFRPRTEMQCRGSFWIFGVFQQVLIAAARRGGIGSAQTMIIPGASAIYAIGRNSGGFGLFNSFACRSSRRSLSAVDFLLLLLAERRSFPSKAIAVVFECGTP